MKFLPHNMNLPKEDFVSKTFEYDNVLPPTNLTIKCLRNDTPTKLYRITGYVSEVNLFLSKLS